MNLIEFLGGYKEAKDALELPLNYDFSDDDIEAALLQYRREHGIYEVGDFIVTDYGLYKLLDVVNGNLYKVGSNEYYNYGLFRHATNAEIEASKALNQCEGT